MSLLEKCIRCVVVSCALTTLPVASVADFEMTTIRVAFGLSRPVFVTAPPGDTERLFIVEQHTGRIKIMDLETGVIKPVFFLDIDGLATATEQGLLGLAFHPDYADNGFFYVNFTQAGSGATNIRRYTVSGDPDVADAGSAQTVLIYSQPQANHNGGWIAFGNDSFLYISTGDGGAQNDTGRGHTADTGNAQDITNTLLGKLLRLDVDGDDFPGDANKNYAIPLDNPFVGIEGDDEIWAYGLRNPWRCSFDRGTNDLYIGDVGQGAREEIDFQPASSMGGENYGWRCMQGNVCTGLTGCICNDPALTDPIHEYSHAGPNCAVTGGYGYRGNAMSCIQGTYFFADYCSNRIWSFRFDGRNVQEFTDRTVELTPDVGSIGSISSFGEDAAGELYICDLGGELFKIVPVVPCPWDLDGTGTIGTSDLLSLLASWGPCKGCPADFDSNGNVGVSDLLTLLANWGPCP